MKTWPSIVFSAVLFSVVSSGSVWGQSVTIEEARAVAGNWIQAIIEERGAWGTAPAAEIDTIQEFQKKGRFVGYFCRVRPMGYIIVSPRREMAPVKAYSAMSNLDPASEEGMADLLKGKMERNYDKVQKIARERKAVTGEEVADTLEIDDRPVWEALLNTPEEFMRKPEKKKSPAGGTEKVPDGADGDAGGEASNYQEGDFLLSSNWHQSPPYNNDCPNQGCARPANGRAIVGCVATAGAQIMYYWGWPSWGEGAPYDDSYDWPNMRDSVTTSSPAAQQAAVAELSHEIGVAVGMDYGCDCDCNANPADCCSWANTADMEGVYQNHYRFADVYRRNRDDYTATGWFDLMKDEFNNNRPVQYRITGHSIVGDGWQEIGSPVVRQYHMNYGWSDTGSDTWYTLDSMTTDPENDEYLLENIMPAPYVTTLTGTFTRQTFPYRYFFRDTTGGSGTFAGGQRIQFLPGIVVTCTSGTVTFQGAASWYSYLFSRGDLTQGLKIENEADAAVKLYPNGSIKFP
jgi:hypothetical protein